ncbi:MAG: hypothetical protein PHV21_08315, partial [Synergistaceae bacterium]|nr:hypothetical protein [Synergistaceae bacterium]
MIIGTRAACERYYALGGRVWSYLFCFLDCSREEISTRMRKRGELRVEDAHSVPEREQLLAK